MNVQENKRIGKALALMRVEAGLKQADLCETLHKPQSYISKIETGERSLQLNELAAYAAALGTTSAQVLERLNIR